MAGKRMRATVSPPPTDPAQGGPRHAQKAAHAARQRPGGVGHQKAQHSAASAPAGASSLNLATGGLMHPCIVKV